MTRQKLLLRNLTHFRLANLAVIAGTAIATAVLTGALMVGDSVRGSLKDLALQRLGPVDHALVSNRFFPQSLATRLSEKTPGATIVPSILLRGGASDAQGLNNTGGVQINAAAQWVPVPRGDSLVNAPVAQELGFKDTPSTLLINVPLPDDQPRDAALARRGRDQALTSLRLTAKPTTDPFPTLFSLAGTQRTPRNIWLNLPELQSTLERPNQINALLVSGQTSSESLNAALKQIATLDDYGLSLTKSPDNQSVILSSATTYLTPPILAAAESAAPANTLQKVSVYLVNHITRLSADAQSKAHYAIAAGINHIDNQPLAPDEVILNQWMADALKAKLGDKIRLDYYQRQPNGDLIETSSDRSGLTFTVKKILPMTGLGADPSLTPSYKGLTDADSISDWQAPAGLHIEKTLITKADENYWDQYKAAPKLFINLDSARKLWGTPLGDINTLRLPADQADAFRSRLLANLDPASVGLVFQPIKEQQVAAATSGTDFSGLFVGLSFFIIASAAMLVAMLFRLAVEQRARQFGLLGALGFTPRTLRRLAILEGLILAAIGALLGVALAVAYTALMVLGLRTWWVGAVGTTALTLHVYPLTLLIGFASSMLIALAAAAFGAWRLGKTEAASLLAGAFASRIKTTGRRIAPSAAIISAIIALALNTAGALHWMDPTIAFMAGGALLLIAGLFAVAAAFSRRPRISTSSASHWSLPRLGLRNAGRNRARSILTVGLIAFAAFVLVSVSAFKQSPPPDSRDKSSGTGGYQLILTADVPLLGDLSTEKGRDVLAIQDTGNPWWSQSTFLSMRSWAGQDMSCLNLTRPTQPTILAAPDALKQRGGFAKPGENPWLKLDEKQDDNTIPVLADHEAATYILKLGLGQTLDIHDQLGRPRKLKLVATLSHSIFQSELLMSESNFRDLFPSQGGFGTVLVETPNPDATRNLLAKELADYAVTIESTTARLARYQEVANTYISTFQTLGSLGLLLGTIGLAVILLRGLIERRAELALLAAIGFTSARRLTLVLAENALLLFLGLAVGTLCALVAIAPALFTSGRAPSLLQLSLTLSAILLTGLLVLVLTLLIAARRITPADLRAE